MAIRFQIKGLGTALATLALVWLVTGCAQRPPRGIVKGRVTMVGQAVTPGTILFENAAAGVSLMADLDADGSFEIASYEGKGLPVGEYRIAITPKVNPADYPSGPPLASEADLAYKEPEYPLFPKKYRRIETSGLVAKVEAGDNAPLLLELEADN